MSVHARSDPTHYPAAITEITDPPSLAMQNADTLTATGSVASSTDQDVPKLNVEPWASALLGATATILASTGGNTGEFAIDAVLGVGSFEVTTDPGNGTDVHVQIPLAGRSGLDDLARRLQNGFTNAADQAVPAVPTTIIGGRILTERISTASYVAPY